MALRKEEMIFKQMTDNIDEALPIVIDKANSFSFNSYARGYHAYMKIWNPVDGEVLVCTRETDNPHDNYAASIIRNSYVRQGLSLLTANQEVPLCRGDRY